MATQLSDTPVPNTQPNRVRILNDRVVNQIAAGEVVERPASVVKELMENSIDAGATEITVLIENGGQSSIEVLDNGHGLSKDDALLAIERFGTSKIKEAEDLLTIRTLGFRGEALPSIASVSRMRLSSKSSSVPSTRGVEIEIDGGDIRQVVERELPSGTRVEVRQLFFNTPARRRFLRSERTETGLIRAVFCDFAAAYPEIRFKLAVDGAEVLIFAPNKSFFERARELRLAGKKALILDTTIDSGIGPLRFEGLLSEPLDAVSSGSRLRLIVNGRVVRDRLLLKAVRDGYGNFLKPGKYPAGIVKITLPPTEIDVNVHPQKTEIRFRSPQIIFASVVQVIRRAFSERGAMVDGSLVDGPSKARESSLTGLGNPIYQPEETSFTFDRSPNFNESSRLEDASVRIDRLRYLGQIFECYLILADDERLLLVDMHAAHERINFYRLKQALLKGNIPAQALLVQETVAVPAETIDKLDLLQPLLRRLGFDCDVFGEDTVVIRTIPAILAGASAAALFRELVSLPEWSDWGTVIDQRWDEVIARLACHGSIRSGRLLEKPEAYQLLYDLQAVEASGLCPHGRPVLKEVSLYELEKMFGRS